MGKCITDAFGKVKHWVLSDNDFVYEYINYERDAYTGRYYRMTDSKYTEEQAKAAFLSKDADKKGR